MHKLALDDIKKIELELMRQVDSICRERGFRYTLIGGTLLGAVRHKGFIPWDDDIDIAMPRRDYDQFIDYCINNNTSFDIISSQTTQDYNYLFAKICDRKTVIQNSSEKWCGNNNVGVYIDVFPLDGMGMNLKEANHNFNRTTFKRELLVAATWKQFTRSKTKSILYEPLRFAFYVISRFVNPKKIISSLENRFRKISFDTSAYVGCYCGSYRRKEIMPATIFQDYIEMEFENTSFMGIKRYDDNLKKIYGDYMKLPPKEKRVTHHSYEVFSKSSIKK